jgi:hypothetical protein
MNSTDKICALNDALRNLTGEGRIYVTAGIAALSDTEQAAIMTRVFTYSDFTPESDPAGASNSFPGPAFLPLGDVLVPLDSTGPMFSVRSR